MESLGAATALRASEEGLRAAAGWCESLATGVAGIGAPTVAGTPGLASAAAVNAAHAQIAAAAVRCSSRIQATAGKLAAASAGYAENESPAASQFRALTPVKVC